MFITFLDGVQLPVTPPSLTTKINDKNEVLTLANGGEINLLKSPGLTDFSATFEFPNQIYPYAVYQSGFKNAKYYLDLMERIKVEKKPVRLIITRTNYDGSTLYDTNALVSLQDYEIEENAENGLDIYVDANFKLYRPYSTKTLNIQPATNPSQKTVAVQQDRSTAGKEVRKTYTVQAGDTLWAIAKKFLNNGNLYKRLQELNNIPNPDLIQPGMVINLE